MEKYLAPFGCLAIHATTPMESGSFFGEIALMEELKRTASVKSVSYCNLYKLQKDDFLNIMNAFEELSSKIIEVKEARGVT